MSPSVNPEALGLEALLTRAESCLIRRTKSYYGGRIRMILSEADFEMALMDLRHALALVLKAKERGADIEATRRIIL